MVETMSETFPISIPPPDGPIQREDGFKESSQSSLTAPCAASDNPSPKQNDHVPCEAHQKQVVHLEGSTNTPPAATPTRQVAPARRTDHTYHDYATQMPSPYEYPITKKSTSNFPAKLHRMISDPANSQAIQWQTHGRGKCLLCFLISRFYA